GAGAPEGRDEPEIEHDDSPRLGHQHVGRLDVPVQLPCGVNRMERVGELDDGVGEAALVEHALPQILDEGRTLYELHRDEAVLVTDEQLVQLHETRVSDVGERPELLFEEVQLGRIPAAERLQGDLGARLEVVDAIHHAHAAAA